MRSRKRLAKPIEKSLNNPERRLFIFFLLVKIFDGIVGFSGGIILLFARPNFLHDIFENYAHKLLSNDELSSLSPYLEKIAHSLSLNAQHFAALYLIFDGATKLAIAYGVYEEKIRMYWFGFVFFFGVTIFQLFRLLTGHSKLLIIWLLIDIAFLILLIRDYLRTKHLINSRK